mmetsp:Transcript_41381/g.74922  ORF Transcript_41381/g.74922 Transcript_41381/m.74922 type:complete len:403 (+) Transcript_41381:61-1269(+)
MAEVVAKTGEEPEVVPIFPEKDAPRSNGAAPANGVAVTEPQQVASSKSEEKPAAEAAGEKPAEAVTSESVARGQEQPAAPPSISLTKPPPELPAELSKDFVVEHSLGEGAYACVMQAKHRQTGAVVALKIVEKQPLAIRNMLPQLQRELRTQSAMQHPNILKLMSCMEDATHVYMLLEFCHGGNLRGMAARLPLHRFPEPMAARYMTQILQGVDFMHRSFCVHRDLKPDNVLLTINDEVRICDFGWSAEVQADRMLLTTCGTPDYWPPEIFEGLPQGAGVDLWELGCLVYEMLVGHPPFWGTMDEIKARVLSVDLRYPPGVLSNEAVNVFYCFLQRDQRARVPAQHMLEQHPWLLQMRGFIAHGQADPNAGLAPSRPPKEAVPTTARPVVWEEIPVAVMITA